MYKIPFDNDLKCLMAATKAHNSTTVGVVSEGMRSIEYSTSEPHIRSGCGRVLDG